MPEISIIIPAHNEESLIDSTLKSIKKQTLQDFEIIVVCDNCNDSTEKIAKRFTKKVYNVKFKCTADSRNFGVKKARGKILVFNDADTRINKNYLEEIRKSADKGSEYGTGTWKSETNSRFGRYWAWLNNRTNRENKITGGNFFVIKNTFNKGGGFTPKLTKGEDTDLTERLRNKGFKFDFLKKAIYFPSERKLKNPAKFYLNSIFESNLYRFNKKGYIKKFSKP